MRVSDLRLCAVGRTWHMVIYLDANIEISPAGVVMLVIAPISPWQSLDAPSFRRSSGS
ncbi:MAG: hypothetical protein WBR33_16120 [Pseudonocardiaceae bacterium]